MSTNEHAFKNGGLFKKIKLISNQKRFKILTLTQNREMGISELSKELKLAYNKCSDYVTLLEKENLVNKRKQGKEQMVKSNVLLKEASVEFSFS